MTILRRALVTAAATASLILLAGCAVGPAGPATPSGSSGGVAVPDGLIAAPGQVVGQGTVIQTGDTPPQLCLGAVMESYPPQCSGSELVGWDWDAVEGEESSGAVTFGAFAVFGGWDGVALTVTDAMWLALYDPMPIVDPLLDPENAGDASDGELARIQDELTASAPFEILTMWPENGYLFVQVVYDDGSIQAWADQTYLPDTVAIRGALRDV
ncbi:MAG: hypothetical protein ABIQ01_03315 [Pseudolysinimonas sp.]